MNNEEFAELHRRWIWANVVKKQFEGEIETSVKNGVTADPHELFPDKYGCYMSVWYGLLFVVLEGLRSLKVEVPEIQADIASIYENLKLFRNATFHAQRKYWSPKHFKIMEADHESAKKIWTIHSGLGAFFLKELKDRKPLQKAEETK